MEDLIEIIVVIIFIVVALVINLVQMASRKKMPLPLPEPFPSEESLEEVEIRLEPEVKIERPTTLVEEPRQIIIKREKRAPEISVIPFSKFSRDELQNGIILSTILGPPRSLSKWVPKG